MRALLIGGPWSGRTIRVDGNHREILVPRLTEPDAPRMLRPDEMEVAPLTHETKVSVYRRGHKATYRYVGEMRP